MNGCEHRTYECWFGIQDYQYYWRTYGTKHEWDFILNPWDEYTLQRIVNTNITNHKLIIKDFLHPELIEQCLQHWPADFYKIEVEGRTQQDITITIGIQNDV